jgi:hypothetical protein
MHLGEAAGSVEWSPLLDGLRPALPWLIALGVAFVVLTFPLPGRGPGPLSSRDPWRTFKYGARRAVMARAGDRCEGALLIAWVRCRDSAEDADHIYPWSRRGATVVSNGQALCRRHNRSKSSMTPPWWYVLTLERRRRGYFPVGADVRVQAGMSKADRSSRSPER